MQVIDKTVRMVAIQFSFSNKELVPQSVREKPFERFREQSQRKERGGTGERVLDPVERCSMHNIIEDLFQHGFSLVDAFSQQRHHPNDHRGRRKYQMVRFVFAQNGFVKFSEEFLQKKDLILRDLQKLLSNSAWRARAFLNPFFQEGERVPEAHHVSLNLEARFPLVKPDGRRRLVWRKDEKGNKLGDTKIPVQPDHVFRIVRGRFEIK